MNSPITLTREMCGERALGHLPDFDAPAEGEFMIVANPVERIDAWGAAALRCMIEYQARYLQRRTTLSRCNEDEAWGVLHALVRDDAPKHLILSNDSAQPEGPAPAAVLLGARPVPAVDQASELAGELLEAAGEELKGPARFAAKYLPELVQNSLRHSKRGPVPPVACSFHDREAGELQLVVIDTGTPRVGGRKTLEQKVLNSDSSSLASLVQAAKGTQDVKLEVAAGAERLRCGKGSSLYATGERVPCFCTALRVSV